MTTNTDKMHKENTIVSGLDLPPSDPPAELDIFAKYALPKGQESVVTTKKLITQVPVRKPGREQWVRTELNPERWHPFPLLELKEDGEMYLVAPEVHEQLAGEPSFIAARLVPSVTDGGVFFYWPIRLPDSNGRINPWHESAATAAEIAREKWVRIVANRSLGGYDVLTAEFEREPQWPDLDPATLIGTAFRGKTIDTIDHPVLLRLKGRAA
jgi:hypothetical protein